MRHAASFTIRRVSEGSRNTQTVATPHRAAFNARSMIALFTATFALAIPLIGVMPFSNVQGSVGTVAAEAAVSSVSDAAISTIAMRVPAVSAPVRSVRRMLHDEGSEKQFNPSTTAKAIVTNVLRSAASVSARRAERLLKLGQSGGSHPAAAVPVVTANPYNQYGVYLTASSAARTEFLQNTFDTLADVGGTTFVVDVKGYWVHYHSAAPVANAIGMVVPTYELPEVLRIAKERGLYTIARYVAVKDEKLTEKKPNWQLKHKTKGHAINVGWVDPANEEALQYNREILCELAAMTDLDEINLDYIRMTSMMPYSTGYTGDEKAERLMAYIRMARETIDRCGSKTKLGVSTYAILGWKFLENRETIGQDVQQYAPYVDVISPMAYPATFTSGGYYAPGKHPGSRNYWLVYRTMTGYAELLGDQSYKLRPWIQAYSLSGTQNVTDQMNAVVDSGFCGFTFWNANNNYSITYAAMKNWKQPERCLSSAVSVGEPKHGKML